MGLIKEKVLVVPRSALFATADLEVDGFAAGSGEAYLEVVDREGRFALRDDVEGDPSLKQIIPYGLVSHEESLFLMQRSVQGGEARLHRKLSLGVGGHVNPEDAPSLGPGGEVVGAIPLRRAVFRAFERELHEELAVESPYQSRVIGVLNDDSNPVGSVHFGVVYLLSVEAPGVRVREEELLSGDFQRLDSLGGRREGLETWSRILLDSLLVVAQGKAGLSEVLF